MKKLFLALGIACAFFASDQARSLFAQEGGYEVFYEDLAPHGTWFEVDDYGYVWRPNLASGDNWRPYVDGNWAHSDRGWTWVSNEPFGWATYHYGRWTELDEVGWVWVPGNEWAPAWVSWRQDNDYIGWAPLPPRTRELEVQVSFDLDGGTLVQDYDIGPAYYNFIPIDRFGARSYREIVLRRDDNIRIIERTTNVTYIKVVNHVVFNFGPVYEEIRVRSREPVRRLTVIEVDHRDRFSGRDRLVALQGDNIEFFAPRVTRREWASRPAKIERRIERRAERNGWEIVKDETARTRLREKVKAEAKDPEKSKQRQAARQNAEKEAAQDVAKAKEGKRNRNEAQDKNLSENEKPAKESQDPALSKSDDPAKDPAIAETRDNKDKADKADRKKDKEDPALSKSDDPAKDPAIAETRDNKDKADKADRKKDKQDPTLSKSDDPAKDPAIAETRDNKDKADKADRKKDKQDSEPVAAATPDATSEKAMKDREDIADTSEKNADKKNADKQKQKDRDKEAAESKPKPQQPADKPVAATPDQDKAARQAERQAERKQNESLATREPKQQQQKQNPAPVQKPREDAQPRQQNNAPESSLPPAAQERNEAPKQQNNQGQQGGGRKNQQQAQPAPNAQGGGQGADDSEGKGNKKKNQL